MQESIAKIRELANQQYRYERKYFNSCPPLSTSSNLVVQRFTGNTNSAGAPNSRCSCCDSGKYSYRVHSRPVFFSPASPNASPIYCDKCEAEDVKIDEGDLLNDTKGGEIICKNFRELLWYWREYYLRRGRDRLSIEFSSHIPFRFWNEVVGKLHVLFLILMFLMVNSRQALCRRRQSVGFTTLTNSSSYQSISKTSQSFVFIEGM